LNALTLGILIIANAVGITPSPLMEARSDYEKYHALSRQMENMIPFPQGTANKRPGTEYVNPMEVVTFIAGSTIYDSFVVDYEDLIIIDSDGEYVPAGGTAYKPADWDLGGGIIKVGIPWAGHDFKVGEWIYLTNSTLQSNAHAPYTTTNGMEVIDVSASAIFVQLDVFTAEVFAGDEVATRFARIDLVGTRARESRQFGNYIYSTVDAEVALPTVITRIDVSDWTEEIDFFETRVGGWSTTDFGVYLRQSSDADFLYISVVRVGSYSNSYIYKYQLSDGTLLGYSPRLYHPEAMDIDDSDRLWARCYTEGLCTLNLSDMAVDTSYEAARTYAVNPLPRTTASKTFGSIGSAENGCLLLTYEDETTGNQVIGTFGNQTSNATNLYNAWPVQVKCDLVDGDDYVFYFTDSDVLVGNGKTFRSVCYNNGYVYARSETVTHEGVQTNVFRWQFTVSQAGNISLADFDQYYIANLRNISVGVDGYIWGVMANPPAVDQLVKYDDNMDVVASLDMGFDLTTSTVLHWMPLLDEVTEASVVAVADTDPTTAYRLIPFEYSTDDAYILGFGDSSLGFYRAGAQIDE
jgi:hypothetical protein